MIEIPTVRLQRWADSMTLPGWGSFEPSSLACLSAGLMYPDQPEDRLVLAQNLNGYQFGNFMQIPTTALDQRVDLRWDWQRKLLTVVEAPAGTRVKVRRP